MWDKTGDILKSFDFIKEQIKKENKLQLVSFDDAYNYYYKYCNVNSHKLIVSKRYFEKYLYYKIPEYIVYEKFIEISWLN
jgi:phage/plasmid-associated DNA primase